MKKLIPAFCLLLVCAVMLGTSTFAWFSMNKSVTAGGMSITAKSDAASLVISKTSTLTPNTFSVTLSDSKTLLPVAHGATAGTKTDITVIADLSDNTKWWYAYSNDEESYAKVASTATTVESGKLGNYLGHSIIYTGIAETGKVGNNLKGSLSLNSNAGVGITVVVVCGTNIHVATASTVSGSEFTLATTVSNTATAVDIYYYIDGENSSVTTKNLENLNDSITLDLTIESISDAPATT